MDTFANVTDTPNSMGAISDIDKGDDYVSSRTVSPSSTDEQLIIDEGLTAAESVLQSTSMMGHHSLALPKPGAMLQLPTNWSMLAGSLLGLQTFLNRTGQINTLTSHSTGAIASDPTFQSPVVRGVPSTYELMLNEDPLLDDEDEILKESPLPSGRCDGLDSSMSTIKTECAETIPPPAEESIDPFSIVRAALADQGSPPDLHRLTNMVPFLNQAQSAGFQLAQQIGLAALISPPGNGGSNGLGGMNAGVFPSPPSWGSVGASTESTAISPVASATSSHVSTIHMSAFKPVYPNHINTGTGKPVFTSMPPPPSLLSTFSFPSNGGATNVPSKWQLQQPFQGQQGFSNQPTAPVDMGKAPVVGPRSWVLSTLNSERERSTDLLQAVKSYLFPDMKPSPSAFPALSNNQSSGCGLPTSSICSLMSQPFGQMSPVQKQIDTNSFDGTNVLCQVCHDKASGFHYGVHACEGCKGFFRRSIQQRIQYRPCTKNQQCTIQRINRNRCQYCRLKKCIAVGMSRDAVRFGRVPKKEKEKMIAEMQKANVQSQVNNLMTELEDENRLIETLIHAHMETCEFTRNRMLPFLERIRQMGCNRPISLMACPLNPNPSASLPVTNGQQHAWEDFSERYSPVIKGVIDFAKCIPGFHVLAQEDQVTLLKAGVFEILVLRLACLFDTNSKTLTLLNGAIYRRDSGIPQQNHGSMGHGGQGRFLIDSLFDFIDRFKCLCLSDADIAIFCALVLISADRPGLRNVELIEKMNLKLQQALKSTLMRSHPGDTSLFNQLMLKLPDLRTLNTLHIEKLLAFKMEPKNGENSALHHFASISGGSTKAASCPRSMPKTCPSSGIQSIATSSHHLADTPPLTPPLSLAAHHTHNLSLLATVAQRCPMVKGSPPGFEDKSCALSVDSGKGTMSEKGSDSEGTTGAFSPTTVPAHQKCPVPTKNSNMPTLKKALQAPPITSLASKHMQPIPDTSMEQLNLRQRTSVVAAMLERKPVPFHPMEPQHMPLGSGPQGAMLPADMFKLQLPINYLGPAGQTLARYAAGNGTLPGTSLNTTTALNGLISVANPVTPYPVQYGGNIVGGGLLQTAIPHLKRGAFDVIRPQSASPSSTKLQAASPTTCISPFGRGFGNTSVNAFQSPFIQSRIPVPPRVIPTAHQRFEPVSMVASQSDLKPAHLSSSPKRQISEISGGDMVCEEPLNLSKKPAIQADSSSRNSYEVLNYSYNGLNSSLLKAATSVH